MRRKDRQISDYESIEILKNGEYGILSLITSEAKPYGVPLNYIYWDHCIYFHCAQEGFKLDNLEKNKYVSFCVVGETEVIPEEFSTKYESVILFGNAKKIEGKEKKSALLKLIEKYSSGYIEKGKEYINDSSDKTIVIKINIENYTGKARR